MTHVTRAAAAASAGPSAAYGSLGMPTPGQALQSGAPRGSQYGGPIAGDAGAPDMKKLDAQRKKDQYRLELEAQMREKVRRGTVQGRWRWLRPSTTMPWN